MCLQIRRPDRRPPTVPVQTPRKTERNPEEKHRPPRTLANKRTGVNHGVPETILTFIESTDFDLL